MKQHGRPLTGEKRESIKTRLAEPFAVEAIKWIVEERTPDGSKGKLLAYVDPRLYIDRLNEIVGPSAWREPNPRRCDGHAVASDLGGISMTSASFG